jgi:hypothetical protein
LNRLLWDPYTQGDVGLSANSGLRIQTDGSQSFSTARIFTLYRFAGDFDVQVDFAPGSGWNDPIVAAGSNPHLAVASLSVYSDQDRQIQIFRNRIPSSDGFSFFTTLDLGGLPQSKFVASSAANGSLRATSSSGTFNLLYSEGSGWKELASAPAWRPMWSPPATLRAGFTVGPARKQWEKSCARQ